MKTMSKFLAFLMALVLLTSCIPAMAEDVENPYAEYGVEIMIDPATGKPYDLGGITVYLYSYNGNEDGSRPEATTAFQMDTYDYQDWLFETYNFEFKTVKQHLYDDNAKALIDFASQETAPAPALFDMVAANMLAPMREGLLREMGCYDFLDPNDASRWQQGLVEPFTLNGKVMALSTSFNTGNGCYLYFNKDLLKDCGVTPEELYSWVENDEWNWEKFEEVMAKCTKDTDADGVIDLYGFVGNGQPEFKAAVYANGGAFFRLNDEGKFYVAASEDATVEAMNWFEKMWFTYRYPQPEGSNWDYYYEAFRSGKAVFFLGSAWEITPEYNGPIADLSEHFEFGAVPFPMGNGVNAYYKAPLSPNAIVLPANVSDEDAWKVLFAYNLMNTPTPGYTEEDEVWKQSLYNIFMDEESVDITAALLRENTFFDFTPMLGNANDMLGSNFFWAYIYDGSLGANTVAELIEGKLPMWNAAIAKANGEEIVEEAPAE